jgi:REP element-mobilizing transposase RayT
MTVIAYHLVWTAYGTWLPNDPRGSGSTSLESEPLVPLGEVHLGRKKVQPLPSVVREFYRKAEPLLEHRVIRFDARQIAIVGSAFAEIIRERNYTCYACAVLPDHVHLVVRKHRDRAEAMILHLMRKSRLRLSETGQIPPEHPVWTSGGYRGFLSDPNAVRAAIRYVERNPGKAGLPAQKWDFVAPYDGWPFHKRKAR